MSNNCSICGQPSGRGDRELRPYGKGGALVCAGCVFGVPEREEEAQRQFKHQGGGDVMVSDGMPPVPLDAVLSPKGRS